MKRSEYHDTPVLEFHEKFGAPVSWEVAVPSSDRRRLRLKLIFEEFLEYVVASGFHMVKAGEDFDFVENLAIQPNISEAADALGDLRVVIDGSNLEWGFPGEEILAEIHRSNMSKLGEDGQPIRREDGKILKGPGYFKPDIARVLLESEVDDE